ncbi:type B DNA-directed DNA polymerase [Natrononativus amylolyticus]|uniref:type B DNA-directed DNA polymerase n=1 Tax=Natrononativus amylolyticus TaxID=2963434 RepID=UPI0020CBC599|nr:type B DNA-directed DNA polymerase [Natrononativus amylolyticus]
MVFTIDYLDDGVYLWTVTADGAAYERITDYRPTLYAAAASTSNGSLETLEVDLQRHPAVVATATERWRPGFRHDHEPVLRIDVRGIDDVQQVARFVRQRDRPGTYRCFNVDFSREFRYCLETGTDPTPGTALSTLELAAAPPELATPPLTELTIDDDYISGSPTTVLETLQARLERVDPDVLVLSSSRLVPVLTESAAEYDVELQLGRLPGVQRLAGASTYESYGDVGHSPARYNVPGRVIVDRSNTFFYTQSGLTGCLDLVGRSWKPLQELGWASIGNVLTAIQIREARDRGVLVPWNSWRHEFFKPMRTLHNADRGGYTFAPDVGLHENVHELDFSSLYPNIICQHNISPETIRCECHSDRADVPGLGYAVCDEPGYLPDVLQPLIDDRDAIKAELERTDDDERRTALRRRSSAIKWILVSCFGYQGFSNAKFGRIECHEAINAYAREILLEAKEILEQNGWRLLHGIVDSVWVTPIDGETQVPLTSLAEATSEEVGIRLEYEAAFEWVAFVPLAESDEGALTKYFGKRCDGEYKFRGIESRQRHTPEWITTLQRECIRLLDDHRSPEAVCAHLQGALQTLRTGEIDPAELVITKRPSKPLDAYRQYTRTVAALERGTDLDLDIQPGQDVSYVVVDDCKRSRERVRLACEEPDQYDSELYADLAIDAVEAVCAPLGWRRAEIERYLSERVNGSLPTYTT